MEPNDATALAQGIQRVLDDEALRTRLVEAGTATAERYRDTRIATEYAQLFQRVIAEHRVAIGAP